MSAPEPPVEPDPERPEPNGDEERGLKSGGYPEWDGSLPRCSICHGTVEHTLACPTRWYS